MPGFFFATFARPPQLRASRRLHSLPPTPFLQAAAGASRRGASFARKKKTLAFLALPFVRSVPLLPPPLHSFPQTPFLQGGGQKLHSTHYRQPLLGRLLPPRGFAPPPLRGGRSPQRTSEARRTGRRGAIMQPHTLHKATAL